MLLGLTPISHSSLFLHGLKKLFSRIVCHQVLRGLEVSETALTELPSLWPS